MKQTPDVAIERALPEDAETICNIRDECWLETYPNKQLGITRQQIELNAQGKDGVFLPRRIAYLSDQIAQEDGITSATFVAKVGSIACGYVSPVKTADSHKISMLYVKPSHQGKGIGYALMRRALDFLGDELPITLEVVAYNEKAIKFYEGFGFEMTSKRVKPDPDMPEYMMALPSIEMLLNRRT